MFREVCYTPQRMRISTYDNGKIRENSTVRILKNKTMFINILVAFSPTMVNGNDLLFVQVKEQNLSNFILTGTYK